MIQPMPAGPVDWHPLDGIFATPDDFMGMYGYWKVGGYALAELKLTGTTLVKVEWEAGEGPYLVAVLGGARLSYNSQDVNRVVKARMISVLEAIAYMADRD